MIRVHLLFFCAFFLHPPALFSQYLDVRSLKDLDSVSVWIEALNENLDGTGITNEALKADVEILLRDAGLTVTDDARDNLYLTVTTVVAGDSLRFACNIKLDYLQGVWLERTNEWNYGSTWFREYLGIYARERITDEILSTVSDLMYLFIGDARSVNPGMRGK